MSLRAFTVLLTALAVLIAYLYFETLNPEAVLVRISGTIHYEISKIGLVALAFASGAAVVLLMVFVEDIRRGLLRWKHKRNEKRQAKIKSLLTQGHHAAVALRIQDAKETFRKVLAQDPNNLEALIHLGTLLRQEQNLREATALHQQAWRIEANHETRQALLADYEATLRWGDALRLVDETLKGEPDNPSALLKKREILEHLGRWEDALAVQEALSASPLAAQDPEAEQKREAGYRTELGYANMSEGDMEKARRAFKTALKTQKDFAPAFLGLAEVALRERNPQESRAIWGRGFQATGNPVFLQRLEAHCLEQGDPNPILVAYREALARKPRDPLLTLLLGKLYYRLEMIDDAFETLSDLEPGREAMPDLHRLIGQLHLRREAPDMAVQHFLQALRLVGEQGKPYRCTACGQEASRWMARCSGCGAWDRIRPDPAAPMWEGAEEKPGPLTALRSAEGAVGGGDPRVTP